eukprot:scaffold2509_cov169-Amphora_coffeaeformis.AAC.6
MDRSRIRRPRPGRAVAEEELCISKESLSNINTEKSLIAGMRPRRRKIKWNSAVSDWDRNGDHTSTRIKVGIDLEELQLLGGVPLKSLEEVTRAPAENFSSISDFSYAEGDAVDVLEKKINRTYETTKHIAKENDEIDEEVGKLNEQNQVLRQEIAAVSMGKYPTKKGLDQLYVAEKRLKKKIRELERQCKLLKRRQKELEEAKRRIRSEDALDETRSYSTQTSKSIATFVDADLDDDEEEEVVVFSAGKTRDSESDSDSENDLGSSPSEGEDEESLSREIKEEDGEGSLGSFARGAEEELSAHKSDLGDSLKELPYEPAIAALASLL